jgi:uric acid transporter
MTHSVPPASAATQRKKRPEDERLPVRSTIAYGLQHVLTMYGRIIAPPLIIAPDSDSR